MAVVTVTHMIATMDRSVVGAIHGRMGTTRHRSGVVMSKKKKVGILTAGGDCPGLNAAIRGFGKAAI
ncbi:MAG: 6-phosphofructokinase, partial [Cutibacterium acnes]|nr:6-phosphofructokinase [Cutibacterium acnes]